MKKLDEIPRNELFSVPDGYFDSLPSRIQARINVGRESQPSFFIAYKLQYILPMVLVAVLAAAFWLSGPQAENDSESLLASVETADLIAYLDESELTTDDVLETVPFDQTDLDEIEQEVYDKQLDGVEYLNADELDLENL